MKQYAIGFLVGVIISMVFFLYSSFQTSTQDKDLVRRLNYIESKVNDIYDNCN